MIDIGEETMLTFEGARLWLGERLGAAPSRAAMRRWITSGVKGAVLESLLVGGRRHTSIEAIQRFISATSGEVKVVTTARRRREIEAAKEEARRVFGVKIRRRS